MGPKVSIIIPTYKRSGNFLRRAIDSVINQTYENIEIVVVDDNVPGSTFRRETEIFMQSYAADSRIKYIKNYANLGGAEARNQGISHAEGEFITFLDDDDIYLPNKIERQLEYMLCNNLDMTFTDLKLCNSDDKLIDYRKYSFIKDFSNQALLKYHILRHITGTPTFMYKREALLNIGGFMNAKTGQEFYLMQKTIESKCRIGYLPVADVIAYVHKGERISSGINKLNGENHLLEFKKRYFHLFTLRERMFIRFRHHIVLAVTGLRDRTYLLLLKHAVLAALASPLDVIIEPIRFTYRLMFSRFSSQYVN